MFRVRVAPAAAVTCFAASLAFVAPASAQDPDQLPSTANLETAGKKSVSVAPHGHQNGQAHARFGIPDIDSLVNFNGHYFADGFDTDGNLKHEWYFNTIGNPPQLGGTTTINAPVVPVIMDLRNADGTPRFVNGKPLVSDPTPFVQPVLNSPVFQDASFTSSGTPTQFTDAVQRAEYFGKAKADWHTRLAPSVKTTRRMVLKRGTYQFALNPDGTCCRFILVDFNTFVNALFPAVATDTTTPIGAAENAGDITTKDLSSFLFPNTFLADFSTGDCCVLGFHSYDFEPGDAGKKQPEKRYVVDYSSWISPGLFGGGFEDVTALSHEIAESYNDPFVVSDGIHNLTPWWLAPFGLCDHVLETGDVLEGLPNATFPMTMNGMTYHPQNEALLQWFEFESPSSALGGVYSYPDTTLLPHLSAPQLPGCK
jgi:hypothetical protein